MTTLATFDIVLRGDTRQFEQSMARAQGTGQSFLKNMTSIASGFVVANVAMAGFSKAMSYGQDALIGYNARMEQAAIGFTTLLGSAEKASIFVKQLQEFAARTPFDFPGLQSASTTMMAMGFTAQEIIPTLTAVGDVVAAMGKSGGEASEAINRIVYNLGQMKQYGRVTGRDIRDLTMLGVPVVKILAKGFKVSTAAMQEMISKGTVPADKALKILTEGIESGNMGGMMAAQAKTFSGAMSTIKDTAQMLVGGALRPLFDAISKIVVKISEWAQTPAATEWMNRIALAVRAFVIILERAIPTVIAFGQGIVQGLTTAVKNVVTIFRAIRLQAEESAKGMAQGGYNAIVAYASGMLQAARTYLTAVVHMITSYISDFLMGLSPPKKGPLSTIDVGGRKVIDAWVQGALSADLSPILSIPKKIASGLKSMEAMAKYIETNLQRISSQLTLVDLNMAKLQLTASRLRRAYEDAIAPLQKQYQILTDTYSLSDKKRDLELELKKNSLQQQINAARGNWWLQEQLQAQLDVLNQQSEANRLIEEEESLKAQIAGIPLEEQMKAITDQYEAQLDPIERQLSILQAQRDELGYQQQVWSAIQVEVERTASAMKAAAESAGKLGKVGGGAKGVGKIGKAAGLDGGIPKEPKNVIEGDLGPSKEEVEKAAQRLADTFINSFVNRIKENWPTMLGAAIGFAIGAAFGMPLLGATIGGAIGTLFSEDIKKAVDDGMKMLQGFLAGGMDEAGKGITTEGVMKFVTDNLQKVFDWVINNGVPLLAEGARRLVEGFIWWFGTALPAILKELPKVFGAIMQFIARNAPVLLKKLITEWLPAFVGWVAEAGPRIIQALINYGAAILQFIVDMTLEWLGAFGTFITTLIDVFDLGQIAEDILNWMGDIGESIAQGIADILETVSKFPADMTTAAANAVQGFMGNLSKLPGQMAGVVGSVLGKAGAFVSDFVGKGIDAGRRFLGGIGDWISKLPGKVAGFLGSVIGKATTFASDLVTKGTNAARDFFNKISEWVGKTPQRVGELINSVITKVTNAAGRMGDAARNIGRMFANGVSNLIEKGVNAIIRGINSLRLPKIQIDTPAGPVGFPGWGGFNLGYINLPSFETGAWNLPRNIVAALHQGEMILPQDIATKFRALIETFEGRPPGVTVNGPLIYIDNFSGSRDDVNDLMNKMSDALRLQTR